MFACLVVYLVTPVYSGRQSTLFRYKYVGVSAGTSHTDSGVGLGSGM